MRNWLSELLGGKPFSEPDTIASEDSELEAFFTGVEYLRQVFRGLAAAPHLAKRLLIIHGVGGVGKSSLLQMNRLFCKRHNIPVAFVSGDQAKTAVDVLRGLADDLIQDGVALPTFAAVLRKYGAIQARVRQKAEDAEGKVSKAAKVLGKATAKTAVKMAASAIPVVGPLVGELGGEGAAAIVGWLHSFLSKPEIDLYLDPAAELTEGFLSDLAQVAEQRRVVLILDTYEQMTNLDAWIRDLFRVLHPNILGVIAGRTTPSVVWDREWRTWMAHAQVEELKPMNEHDMRVLVRRYHAMVPGDEPDATQVEAIVRFARGLPLLATTAVRLWTHYGVPEFQTVKPQAIADVVDQLLREVPETMRPALEAAAVLHWFRKDVLRAVLGQEEVRATYRELRSFPFVRPRTEGLAIHDTFREVMNTYLATHDPERYHTLHKRAAAFYEGQLGEADEKGEKWGEEYKALMLERLYHSFKVHEEEGLELFTALWDSEAYYQVDFLQKVFAAMGSWVLRAPASGKMRYYQGRFELWHNGNPPRAKEILKSLHRELDVNDLELLAMVTLELASASHELAEFDNAIEYCRQSKSLFEQLGDIGGATWALQIMGSAYNRMGAYAQAIESYEGAIERAGAEEYLRGQCLYRVGDPYRRTGQCDKALECFIQSLAIWRRLGHKRMTGLLQGWIGDALRSQYRLDDAFTWFSRSLQTYQELNRQFPGMWELKMEMGNPKYNLARIRLLEGDLDDALRYAEETGEIWETADQTRREMLARLLGRIFHAKGELSRARQHYTESLDLSNWMDHKIDSLLYLTILGYDEATAPSHLDELERLALRHDCWEHLARLRVVQGNLTIDEAHRLADRGEERARLLHDAFAKYSEAMIYALRFNRFLLDHVLGRVIHRCEEQGAEGSTLLTWLADLWRTGKTEEGTPLVEIERIGREREKGDGQPQTQVMRQIEAAMSSLDAVHTGP